jgi:hypothetical protein
MLKTEFKNKVLYYNPFTNLYRANAEDSSVSEDELELRASTSRR